MRHVDADHGITNFFFGSRGYRDRLKILARFFGSPMISLVCILLEIISVVIRLTVSS
jgi:hypothetical protein